LATSIVFEPLSIELSSIETRAIPVDIANLLAQGETATSPQSSLTDLITGVPYPGGLSGDPSLVGTRISQTITALQPGRRYRLNLSWAVGPERRVQPIELRCKF
jgi:hypothetical protein